LPRQRAFPLPKAPLKIYQAPDLNPDPYLNLMDWGPQANPYVSNPKLAIALLD